MILRWCGPPCPADERVQQSRDRKGVENIAHEQWRIVMNTAR